MTKAFLLPQTLHQNLASTAQITPKTFTKATINGILGINDILSPSAALPTRRYNDNETIVLVQSVPVAVRLSKRMKMMVWKRANQSFDSLELLDAFRKARGREVIDVVIDNRETDTIGGDDEE